MEMICGKPVLFKKEFKHDGTTFSAINAAQAFLREKGFSYGSMQREAPIGIARGNVEISKWRNLSSADILSLDGSIVFPDKNPREGSAIVYLNVNLEE